MSLESQPEFRLATVADAELLLDFMREYYEFDGHHYEREKARVALLGLLGNSAFGLAWLIFDRDPDLDPDRGPDLDPGLDARTPVGYIVVCFGYSLEYLGRDAFVDELYLEESYRGRGWGKKAMEFVRDQAQRQNIRAIHLEVVRRNTHAFEFYRRLGFKDHNHYLMTLSLAERC